MRTLVAFPGKFILCAATTTVLTLCGCITSRSEPDVSLSPRDFAGSTGPAPASPARAARGGGPAARTGPLAAQEGMFDVAATTGAPEVSSSPPPANGLPTLVDGTVGNINNKAVYIGDFLAPIEAELLAKTKELRRAEWSAYARDLIKENLNQQIEDELLQAEAIASFSPEQKQGLQYVVEGFRQRLVSQNYGSPAIAAQALRNRAGQSLDEFEEAGSSSMSLEEWTQEERTKFLIGYQLNEQIMKRVSISWREIQLAYERAHEKFNPPPTAVFRMIRVSGDNSQNIEAVTQALASGKDFAEIAASDLNEYEAKTGGIMKVPFKEEFAKTMFFGVPELNEAAQGLSPGAWTGPIKLTTNRVWIKLDHVEEFSMPIYQAQLVVEGELRERRVFNDRARYIQRLRQRASFTDVDEMTDRLLAIAAERYYPPGAPQPASSTRPARPAAPGRPGS